MIVYVFQLVSQLSLHTENLRLKSEIRLQQYYYSIPMYFGAILNSSNEYKTCSIWSSVQLYQK